MIGALKVSAPPARAATHCRTCSASTPAPTTQRASRHGSVRQLRRSTWCTAFGGRTLDVTPEAPASEEEQEEVEEATDLSGSPYQQTLNRSFYVGGVGLHSGEYAWVRVRPAFAGDGRYFVIVPKGTNSGSFDPEAEIAPSTAPDSEAASFKARQSEVFMQYQRMKQDGFAGSFEDFAEETGNPDLAGVRTVQIDDSIEPPVPVGAGDRVVPATVESLFYQTPYTTVLGKDDDAIASVETLLAALEGLHVDNVRIEIEGGQELPVMDGSAQGWVRHIANVGVRIAETEDTGEWARKASYQLNDVISVHDGDSFVSLYPGLQYKITCGVTKAAAVIGTQWRTFHTLGSNEENFAFDVAPARTWIDSTEHAYEMKDAGFLRAGTVGCVMIADGVQWITNADVRFLQDEPVRHNMIELMGLLSLMGNKGNSGIPYGHIVSYNADQRLLQIFVRGLYERMCEEGGGNQVPFVIMEEDVKLMQQQMEAAEASETGDAAPGAVDPDAESNL